METSRFTPTAPEAARLIDGLLDTLNRAVRRLAGAAADRLVRAGTRLGRWAEVCREARVGPDAPAEPVREP